MNLFGFGRLSQPSSGKTKTSRLQFQGQEVLVIRRARRRSVTIHMRPHEPIKVTSALGVSDDQILNFLNKKIKWVEKNWAQFQEVPKPVKRGALPGEKWQFQGRDLVFQESITVGARPVVKWMEEKVVLYWPEKKWAKRNDLREQALKWLEQSLKTEAEKLLKARVEIYSRQMQLFPKRIRLMKAKTRWGSCSSRGYVNFNAKLIQAPLWVLDAIVVHELAHLQHMNHSKKFWDLVETHAPEHKAADLWLKSLI